MGVEKPKNKGGRPKEELADKVDFAQVERLAGLGLTDEEIGFVLGYSERTINRWKEDERFLSVLKRGKAKADSKVLEGLYKKATGFEREEVKIFQYEGSPLIVPFTAYYPPDTGAAFIWLKNRQPDRWRDKRDLDVNGKIGAYVIDVEDEQQDED